MLPGIKKDGHTVPFFNNAIIISTSKNYFEPRSGPLFQNAVHGSPHHTQAILLFYPMHPGYPGIGVHLLYFPS